VTQRGFPGRDRSIPGYGQPCFGSRGREFKSRRPDSEKRLNHEGLRQLRRTVAHCHQSELPSSTQTSRCHWGEDDGGVERGYGAGMVFLLRMLLVMLAVPLFVIVDWAAYRYLGSTAGGVTAVISIPAVIYTVWRLSRFDEDDVDPLAADRRRR
jgi:hypothetical protein